MNLFLAIILIYLAYTSSILIRNLFSISKLEDFLPNEKIEVSQSPVISICIPARNEERSISKSVEAACRLSYTDFEVIVLNDQSTDATGDILNSLLEKFPNTLKVIQGTEKPSDWLGKPFACHQLSKHASGEYLIFVDADTILSDEAVSAALNVMRSNNLGFCTVWPRQITDNVSEKIIIPHVYFALLTLLPWHYTERKPKWMPNFFHQRFKDMFAAACGQYVMFTREAYHQIGGHESVKNEVVEDVALAKMIKNADITMKMLYGSTQVACRMYESHQEVWQGFRKNFFAGFSYNLFLFLIMAIIHIAVFLVPIGILLASLFVDMSSEIIMLSLLAFMIVLVQRAAVQRLMSLPLLYSFTHPIGVIWFQILGLRCISDYLLGKKVSWKDRQVN